MAWNQPGGQNNNPWGNRRPNNGGGGSNLDERVKDWQRKFESLFRPGGKGEGGALFITVLLLILTLWLFSGFFQVKAAERGVIQRFGKVILPVRTEGWGWRLPWPIDTVTKVNVAKVNSKDFKPRVLTADVNLVDVRFAVQYTVLGSDQGAVRRDGSGRHAARGERERDPPGHRPERSG